jgi:predicted Zn-ribbon and HTH transcriptional regulator
MNLMEFEGQVLRKAAHEDFGPMAGDPLFRDLYNQRPGLDPIESFNTTVARPAMYLAAFFEQEVSIFADTVQTIVQETLRNGVEWKPRFASKCKLCDFESQEEIDKCPNCGSDQLREPNKSELRLFSRLDGTSFIDKANDNGQSLMDVLNLAVRNTVVFDKPVWLLINAYVTKPTGEVDRVYPQELLALDPRYVEPIYDRNSGRFGNGTRVCLRHRDESQAGDKCKTCGMKLYDIQYRSVATGAARSYVEGEVITGSLYHPFLITGYPLILKMADDMFAYHYIEKRIRKNFEKGRPPGMIGVKSSNPASLYAEWQKIQAKMKEDPSYVPIIACDAAGSGSPITYVNLMQDLNAYVLPMKEEIRQRHGSLFGVSIIYQNDTSNSGGLKNDLNLIRVTRNTIERMRGFVDDKLLRPLIRAFGIEDHDLIIKPDDDEDKAAELAMKQKEAEYAKTLADMGIGTEYIDGNWRFASGEVKATATATVGGATPRMGYLEASQARALFETHTGTANEIRERLGQEPLTNEEITALRASDSQGPSAPMNGAPTSQPISFEQRAKDIIGSTPQVTKAMTAGIEDISEGEMTDEEYCDSLVSKAFFKDRTKRQRLLEALGLTQRMSSFQNLSPQEAEGAYGKIIDIMSKAKWTVQEVRAALQRTYPQLPDANAEAIARTESMVIAGTARELDFQENNPPDALYKWQGPDDKRTTDACREAVKGSKNGMRLPDLKEYLHTVAKSHGMNPRDWVLHPNERHRAVRVVA